MIKILSVLKIRIRYVCKYTKYEED